jgi:hypothetical protein
MKTLEKTHEGSVFIPIKISLSVLHGRPGIVTKPIDGCRSGSVNVLGCEFAAISASELKTGDWAYVISHDSHSLFVGRIDSVPEGDTSYSQDACFEDEEDTVHHSYVSAQKTRGDAGCF